METFLSLTFFSSSSRQMKKRNMSTLSSTSSTCGSFRYCGSVRCLCATIVTLDVCAIYVFDSIKLLTLLPGKYQVITETFQDDNELRFLAMNEAILTKKNYDFNDVKRTLLRPV